MCQVLGAGSLQILNALSKATSKSPKSLMRMLGLKGNPQARNIFGIIAHLQKKEGIQFKVQAVR